jgi:hypothetical protein
MSDDVNNNCVKIRGRGSLVRSFSDNPYEKKKKKDDTTTDPVKNESSFNRDCNTEKQEASVCLEESQSCSLEPLDPVEPLQKPAIKRVRGLQRTENAVFTRCRAASGSELLICARRNDKNKDISPPTIPHPRSQSTTYIKKPKVTVPLDLESLSKTYEETIASESNLMALKEYRTRGPYSPIKQPKIKSHHVSAMLIDYQVDDTSMTNLITNLKSDQTLYEEKEKRFSVVPEYHEEARTKERKISSPSHERRIYLKKNGIAAPVFPDDDTTVTPIMKESEYPLPLVVAKEKKIPVIKITNVTNITNITNITHITNTTVSCEKHRKITTTATSGPTNNEKNLTTHYSDSKEKETPIDNNNEKRIIPSSCSSSSSSSERKLTPSCSSSSNETESLMCCVPKSEQTGPLVYSKRNPVSESEETEPLVHSEKKPSFKSDEPSEPLVFSERKPVFKSDETEPPVYNERKLGFESAKPESPVYSERRPVFKAVKTEHSIYNDRDLGFGAGTFEALRNDDYLTMLGTYHPDYEETVEKEKEEVKEKPCIFNTASPRKRDITPESDRIILSPRQRIMKDSIEIYKSHENRIMNFPKKKDTMIKSKALFCFVCDTHLYTNLRDYTDHLVPTEMKKNYASFVECYIYRVVRFCPACFKEYNRRLVALREVEKSLILVEITPQALKLFTKIPK